ERLGQAAAARLPARNCRRLGFGGVILQPVYYSPSVTRFLICSERMGGTVAHPFFEAGMYSLSNILEDIVRVLHGAGVAFEVVGGVAVNAHIFAKDQSHSFVTRDVDLLLHRTDLDRVAKAAEAHGYAAKKIMGGF